MATLVFVIASFVAIVAGIVLVGRGRSGRRITGPQDRPVDYDNPYGTGVYFFTGKRPDERR